MRTSLALVHHGNQYLITTGYDNREGIEAIVGSDGIAIGIPIHSGFASTRGHSTQSASQRNPDRSDRMA